MGFWCSLPLDLLRSFRKCVSEGERGEAGVHVLHGSLFSGGSTGTNSPTVLGRAFVNAELVPRNIPCDTIRKSLRLHWTICKAAIKVWIRAEVSSDIQLGMDPLPSSHGHW